MTCFSHQSRAWLGRSIIPNILNIFPVSQLLLRWDFPERASWKHGVELLAQFGRIVIFEKPFLSLSMRVAIFHQELLIITADCHTTVRWLMMELLCIDFVGPELKSKPNLKWWTWNGDENSLDFLFHHGMDTKLHQNQQSPNKLRRGEFHRFCWASSTALF